MPEHAIYRHTIQGDSELPRNVKGQRARILRLLLDAKGTWVPLPQILELHISQFGARILELRRLNFRIENKTERDDSGVIHSWYRLVSDAPEAEIPESNPSKPAPEWKDRPRLTGLPLFDNAGAR
jgi:hypothetical protein